MATEVSSEVKVPVAREYRNYLLRRQNWTFFVLLLMMLGPSIHSYYFHPTTWRPIGHLQSWFHVFVVALLWFAEISKENSRDWRCTLSKYHLSCPGYGFCEWFWTWYKLTEWTTVVLSISEERWNGLPALRIVVKTKKGLFRRKNLFFVYSPDDQDSVRMELLPMLERDWRQSHESS